MPTAPTHILVCASFRLTGAPQGVCYKKGCTDLLQYLEEGINDRGLDVLVSSTGCLKRCEQGPILVVHPANAWYGQVDEDGVDRILDGLEAGELPAAGRIG